VKIQQDGHAENLLTMADDVRSHYLMQVCHPSKGPAAAAVEEARPRPRADVELSTDIELIYSV